MRPPSLPAFGKLPREPSSGKGSTVEGAVEAVTKGGATNLFGSSQRQDISAECARRGRCAVVTGCVDLLEARPVGDSLVLALGGAHGNVLRSGNEGGKTGLLAESLRRTGTARSLGGPGDRSNGRWHHRRVLAYAR